MSAILFLSTTLPQGADAAGQTQDRDLARKILSETGTKGGLVVHLGCGDGRLTAALGTGESYLIHGLDVHADDVAAARKQIKSQGLYGRVSVSRLTGDRLPYVDNSVNPPLYRVRMGPIQGVEQYDLLVDELAKLGIADSIIVTD